YNVHFMLRFYVHTDSARLSKRKYPEMMNRLSTWPLPFRILNTSRDLDELFSHFLGGWEQGRIPRPAAPAAYVPQIASYVDGDRLCIRADLPGVDPQEVELLVEENQLTLKGERKVEQEQQNGHRLAQEVQYGAFARTFTLPEGGPPEGPPGGSH